MGYMRFCYDLYGPPDLHMGLFAVCIMQQADSEQQAKWLPLAKSFEIFGAYA